MTSFDTIRKGYAGMNAGVWVGQIPIALFDGVRLKVKRAWNPDYAKLHAEVMEEAGDLSDAEKERRATDRCLVETCLIGWDGVDEPFSADTAQQLLADPDFGLPFRGALIYAVSNVDATVKAQLESDAKNS